MRRALLDWYDGNARDLPWRRTRDPFAVWVAEVMLQQTRVETVIPYYARFLARFPDVFALADARLDDVLASWSGLGYYRRARLLHAGAMHVRDVHGGVVPSDPIAIREIPGVGAYTAGAIASQAFGANEPIVDGNVARFVSRLCAIDVDVKKGEGLARVWRISAALVASVERPGALNNALMEIGATVCVPREPRCLLCPVRAHCAARARGRETELPIATKKAKRPTVEEIAAVLRIEGDDRVLLARCAKDGLFAGLWEPPRVATKDAKRARVELSSSLGVDVDLAPKPKRSIEHALTHRRLRIEVHEGVLSRAPKKATNGEGRYDAWELVDLATLDARGVATLGRRMLGLSRRGRPRPPG